MLGQRAGWSTLAGLPKIFLHIRCLYGIKSFPLHGSWNIGRGGEESETRIRDDEKKRPKKESRKAGKQEMGTENADGGLERLTMANLKAGEMKIFARQGWRFLREEMKEMKY